MDDMVENTPDGIALERIEKAILENANTLDFRNLELVYLPLRIGNISNLESLDLSGNSLLSKLSSDIKNLKNLKRLRLDLCGLESFPTAFTQLTNLRSLELSYNPLKTFPLEIVAFAELEYLGFHFA